MFPEAWVSGVDGKWFEGYDGHEDVIFDDFRGDFCKLRVLLRLLDRYEYRVEVKGSSRQFLAKNIVITSCYSPTQVYKNNGDGENINQLVRRITEIRRFGPPTAADIEEKSINHLIMAHTRPTQVAGNTKRRLEEEEESSGAPEEFRGFSLPDPPPGLASRNKFNSIESEAIVKRMLKDSIE